ncbi:hypothetical protein [Methylocella silvestris]|uniref:Uncharacterized protein n=1 Tax=Methylocella silvestris TaxID=199596 RepID=A0A2J7TG09_METSI|nr:hypothetical protein [Methylocella silvestris]PNG25702.1 hypothetical protein CR492_12345 [Methylocella silvestris]
MTIRLYNFVPDPKGKRNSNVTIYDAVVHHGCEYVPILNDMDGRPFDLDSLVRPTIFKIWDIEEGSEGSAGFDKPSLTRLIDLSALVTILTRTSSAGYCEAVRVAKESRMHSLIIVSREHRVQRWMQVVQGRHGEGIRIALWTHGDCGWLQ